MLRQSEKVDLISAALLKAQRNVGGAVKGSDNPFFKSKYADLGAVMEACKDALNQEGIFVSQPMHWDEHGYYVTTELRHESGQYFASTIKLILAKNDMQMLGASCSYARRYLLQSMLFIPAEDDDGNMEVGMNKQVQQQQQRPPQGNQAPPIGRPMNVARPNPNPQLQHQQQASQFDRQHYANINVRP